MASSLDSSVGLRPASSLSQALRDAAQRIEIGDLEGGLKLLSWKCHCGKIAHYACSDTEFQCKLHYKQKNTAYELPTFEKPSLDRCTATTKSGKRCWNRRRLGSDLCGVHGTAEVACACCDEPFHKGTSQVTCSSCVVSSATDRYASGGLWPEPRLDNTKVRGLPSWPELMIQAGRTVTKTPMPANTTYISLWDTPRSEPPEVPFDTNKSKLEFLTLISRDSYEKVATLFCQLSVYLDTCQVQDKEPQPWCLSLRDACKFKLAGSSKTRDRWEKVEIF